MSLSHGSCLMMIGSKFHVDFKHSLEKHRVSKTDLSIPASTKRKDVDTYVEHHKQLETEKALLEKGCSIESDEIGPRVNITFRTIH